MEKEGTSNKNNKNTSTTLGEHAKHFRLQEAAHVSLEEIVECYNSKLFNEQARAFARSVELLGFAYLKVPAQVVLQIQKCYDVAFKFFESNSKRDNAMGAVRDVGYMDLLKTSGKEYIQMRYTKDPNYKWPVEPADFEQVTGDLFKMFTQLTKYCLVALAMNMNVDPKIFIDILDTDEQQAKIENYWSSTIYRYFCYRNQDHSEEPCKIHTDIGLLTLIPVTKVPQLQILDQLTFEWLHIELVGDHRDEIIVFGGETLEHLTGYFYQAPIHRVGYLGEAFASKGADLREDEEESVAEEMDGRDYKIKRKKVDYEHRLSIVWLCRGRSEAVLDTQALQPSRLEDVPKDCQEIMTVGEFMKKKYATKKSANGLNTAASGETGFPGINFLEKSKEVEKK